MILRAAQPGPRCWCRWANCHLHVKHWRGAALAPRNQATLDVLRDATRRPSRARDPLPDAVTSHVPVRPFDLDEAQFCRNLRSARRGAAAGPSGMTTEHLRPLLNDPHTTNLFFRVGEKLCRGEVPQSVVRMVRQGRMTALAKPDGGVRGIVAGDVIRRLVARTMAQQLGEAVETATAPHQYALRTKGWMRVRGSCAAGLDRTRSTGNHHFNRRHQRFST